MRSTTPRTAVPSSSRSGSSDEPGGDSSVASSRGTKRPAAAIVLSYLVVTLPLALRAVTVPGVASTVAAGATAGRGWLVIAVHVACIAALGWTTWRGVVGRRLGVVADWLPLLLVAFLYSELPWLMAGYRGAAPVAYHDAWVQQWELAVFGTQPSHTLAGALPFRGLSEAVHAGYVSYYLIIYLPPLVLYASRRREAFGCCAGALMLAFTSCFLVFALFPVEGPRYAWASPPGVPDGIIRGLTSWVLREGSSRGAAFPSSHAAVAVAQTVSLWLIGARRLSGVVGVLTALLVVGAVYGGFHYAIDMAVGVVVGVACALAGVALCRRIG